MLVVGTDSYVSVQAATAYIAAHYTSTDKRRAAWDALEEPDQEVYLRGATMEMDRLPYRGVKRSIPQVLAFPRCYDPNAYFLPAGDVVSDDAFRDPSAADVPQAVLAAEIEEALELAAPTEDTENRAITGGAVRSYSIGHMSEAFNTAATGSLETVIASRKAQELLAPYVGGGYGLR